MNCQELTREIFIFSFALRPKQECKIVTRHTFYNVIDSLEDIRNDKKNKAVLKAT